MAVVPIRGLNTMSEIQQAAELAQKAIGRVPGAAVEFTTDALDKLRWLANGGRDFREENKVMRDEVNGAFVKALHRVMKGKAPVTEPWRMAAEAYRDRLATRLATSGGDVKAHMKKLKASTIERKGHARIGVDTGDLLREVATTKVRVTRG
jgi:hypothetical protein